MMLYQVTALHFCAGIIVDDWGSIVQTAPVLREFLYSDFKWFTDVCRQHGWQFHSVHEIRPDTDAHRRRRYAQALRPCAVL